MTKTPEERILPVVDKPLLTSFVTLTRGCVCLATLGFVLSVTCARAASLYWDTNGATAGSGAATGTWGTSAFWSTNSGGTVATAATPTTNADDLFFSAGTNGTTGTVTINGAQLAHSITLDDAVAITLSGGTSINLGSATANSGIFATVAANNTISTDIIVNSLATALSFSNTSTGTLTIGNVAGAATSGTQAITLNSTSTGNVVMSGIISDGGAGGKVSVTKTGTGLATLTGTNSYTGATAVNAGTLALSFDGAVTTNILSTSSALTLGGGTLQLTGANTATQTVNGLTTTANTGSRILLDANKTLTLGNLTSAGSNSGLNFNTAAGGNAGATVGTSIIVLTGKTAGSVINTGFTVTDSTGFALATVNASNQIVRLAGGTLLPGSGASSSTNYRMDSTLGLSQTVTTSQSAGSITVDTTGGSGTITVNDGVILSNSVWNFGAASGTSTYAVNPNGAGGTGQIRAAASGGTISFNNYSPGTVTIGAQIVNNTSASAVVFNGTGTTTLTNANTFTGGTTVTGGTLTLANGLALQNSTVTTGGTGIVFDSSVASHAFTFGGLSGSTNLSLLDNAGTPNAVALTVGNNNATTTYSGVFSGAGSSLIKNGTGTLVLTGNNAAYTGAIIVSGGVLSTNGAAGNSTNNFGTGPITVQDGGTISMSSTRSVTWGTVTLNGAGASGWAGALVGGGGSSFGNTGSTAFVLGSDARIGTTNSGSSYTVGAVNLGAFTLTLNAAGTTALGISGVISGTGGVIQNNGSSATTTTLSGANTYTGSTTITAGTLIAQNAGVAGVSSALGKDSAVTLANAATANLQLNANLRIGSLSGGGTTGGNVNLQTFTLTVGADNSSTSYAGAISGTTGALTKMGTGTLTLAGTNTYGGTATVSAGVLLTTKATALSGYNTANKVVFNGGTVGVQVGGAGWTTTEVDTLLANATKTSGALGIDTTNGDLTQWTGFTTANFGSTLGLTKLGANTLTLDKANDYNGATTVSGGALQVGSGGVGQTGTGAVSVKLGSLILGTGRLQGSSFTAESGSTVQAGDGTAQGNYGTLTLKTASGSGVYDFQSGSTTILGINPGGSGDLLNIDGNLNGTLLFNGNLQVTASGYVPTAVETFNLLDWVNISTLTFNSRFNAGSYGGYLYGNGDDNLGFDLPDISGSGYGWDISQFTTDGTISTVLSVPEPSRALMFLLGMAGLFLRRQRRSPGQRLTRKQA